MELKQIFEETNQLLSKILYYQVSASILRSDQSHYRFLIYSQNTLPSNLVEEIVNIIKRKQLESRNNISLNFDDLTPENLINETEKTLPALTHLPYYIVAPLSIQKSHNGFMALFRSEVDFTEKDREIFMNFVNYLGKYIEAEYQKEYFYANFFDVLKAMSYAIEALDPFFHGHASRVERYAFKIAEKLNFSEEMKKDLQYLCIIHDIGKVGLPLFILGKTGRLDKEEFEIVKEHTVIGEQILESVPLLKKIRPLIRFHHERFDGKGYPDGVSGENIPLCSRILNVVDSYDAMITNRPYRLAFTKEEAIDEVEKNAGAQFDPQVAKIFVEILREEFKKECNLKTLK
ncbi:MAG: HD-GYP domain-containing protein [Candidatus Firestonebacteria bacterium]|nr:HD-GYP domain-containing protein [Candidatus Firestonebacteria bacterium]